MRASLALTAVFSVSAMLAAGRAWAEAEVYRVTGLPPGRP